MSAHRTALPPPGGLSLWLDRLDEDCTPQNPLMNDLDVDVAIVGGGYTGLWTAWALARRDPSIRVAVLERQFCGYGASGRNGGWVVGELAGGVSAYESRVGRAEALRLVRAVFATVDDIGTAAAADGIDCDFAKGGAVYVARNAAQEKRQRETIAHERSLGITEGEIRALSVDEARSMIGASDVRSGIFYAPCAAVDPAKLVRGLRRAVVDAGIAVHEGTTVESIEPGLVRTSGGTVRADVVVRATEGYTRDLPGERRTMVPLYSLMIATEPLPPDVIGEIGLEGRPTFADDRYAVIYGQRTADDRLAFGGRGVPYAFGSAITADLEHDVATHELVHRTLLELFPILGDVEITHRWGGVLGAPRNWTQSVDLDPETGMGSAGGYVGEGVAPSHLAGRTMAELILDRNGGDADDELTSLAWVNASGRKWEPEPLRWLGVAGTRRVMSAADRIEFETGRESRRGKLASKLL